MLFGTAPLLYAVRYAGANSTLQLLSSQLFCFDTINRTWRSRWMMIWLLEDVLRQIPRGIHEWGKFVRPEELEELLVAAGFGEVVMEGFDLFGRDVFGQVGNLVHFWRTGGFRLRFDGDMGVMYIGVAQWGEGLPRQLALDSKSQGSLDQNRSSD